METDSALLESLPSSLQITIIVCQIASRNSVCIVSYLPTSFYYEVLYISSILAGGHTGVIAFLV